MIQLIINGMRSDSDAGPTGINAIHLKYLANKHPNFCNLVLHLAQKLLRSNIEPMDNSRIPLLYRYKLILGLKED